MKMKVAAIAAALLASASLLATEAAAGKSWTGCSIGVQGGVAALDNKVALTGTPLEIEGLSADGHVVGVHGGCDLQFNALVVGLFANYSWDSAEFSVQPNLLSLKWDNTWNVGGRVGVAIGSVLPYAHVAYTQSEAEMTVLGGAIPASLIGDLSSMTGYTIGLGIETPIFDTPFTLTAEYGYTIYDNVPLLGGLVDLETDKHQMVARVSYRFGASGLGASEPLK